MTEKQAKRDTGLLAVDRTIAPFLWALNQPVIYNDLRAVFYTCNAVRHSAGWHCAAHVHDYFESHLVTEGTVCTTLDGRKMQVEPGGFYIIPPGVVHSHEVQADVEDAGIVLRWSLERIDCPPDVPRVADEVIRALSRVCTQPFDAGTMHGVFFHEECIYTLPEAQVILLRWLLELHALYQHIADTNLSAARQQLNAQQLVASVMVTIDTIHTSDITVEDIARMHGVSYRQLARLFKRITGRTLSQALSAARLSHAMHLLAETELPIQQIAERVGFSSPYYFTNVFSDTYGMSPKQVRKILLGKKIEGGSSV